jgi:hypothetical protein
MVTLSEHGKENVVSDTTATLTTTLALYKNRKGLVNPCLKYFEDVEKSLDKFCISMMHKPFRLSPNTLLLL